MTEEELMFYQEDLFGPLGSEQAKAFSEAWKEEELRIRMERTIEILVTDGLGYDAVNPPVKTTVQLDGHLDAMDKRAQRNDRWFSRIVLRDRRVPYGSTPEADNTPFPGLLEIEMLWEPKPYVCTYMYGRDKSS